MTGKAPDAFRTISEVADWLGVNAHVLRFWESKFSQIKPVKRAGGRRYYRPSDMELLGGIQKLLHEDGMTIKGVQKVLREKGIRAVCSMSKPVDDLSAAAAPAAEESASPEPAEAPMAAPNVPLAEPPDASTEQERDGADSEEPAPVIAQAPMPVGAEESGDGDPISAEASVEEAVAEEAAMNGVMAVPESPASPEPTSERDSATMPLFAHRQEPPSRPDAPDLAPRADRGKEDTETPADPTEPETTPPASTGPVVAPLPRSDIPLNEALAALTPGVIDPARLRPIHARLVALRERMGRRG